MAEEGSVVPGQAPRGPRPAAHRRRLWIGGVVGSVLIAAAVAGSIIRADGDDDAVRSGGGPTTTSAPTGASGPSTTAATGSGRATTTTRASTTTTAAPKGPKSITLAFAGDLLPHLPLVAQAGDYGRSSGQPYDFAPMLAPMRPVVGDADLAICHMETPVAPDQSRISGYPAFGAPAQLVDAAKATGYDGCSTASNHSLDQGRAGIDATLARFDKDGLRHAGTARTAEEGAATTIYDVKGVKVAHLSYAYDFNGYKIPGDAPFAVNQIDSNRIKADARRAHEAGAQFVVVSLHWGTEYQHQPNQYQQDVASLVLPSPDIDLIIGHHAHVVQPIEQIDGTYVVWGLGNQLANQPEVPRSDGLTVVATVSRQADGHYRASGIEAVPTYIEAGTYRVLPIVRTLADPSTSPALRRLLTESYDRTAGVLITRRTPGIKLALKP